ncbi:Hypothetical protein RAK1035_4125 (plasmid) [Roseovarius sp. AK1035]|nr:Hypothetical protein RAK1035_4125 [Roseovarius sp. AK1035]
MSLHVCKIPHFCILPKCFVRVRLHTLYSTGARWSARAR